MTKYAMTLSNDLSGVHQNASYQYQAASYTGCFLRANTSCQHIHTSGVYYPESIIHNQFLHCSFIWLVNKWQRKEAKRIATVCICWKHFLFFSKKNGLSNPKKWIHLFKGKFKVIILNSPHKSSILKMTREVKINKGAGGIHVPSLPWAVSLEINTTNFTCR